jgi:hypothetical protein
MKCHAGVEFTSGKPCPKCNAKLGEVCWPGINADLKELPLLREENARLRDALRSVQKIISTGAMTGFNWKDGDWADRLFESQRVTSAALQGERTEPPVVKP